MNKLLEVHLQIGQDSINPRIRSHPAFPLLEPSMPTGVLKDIKLRKERIKSIYMVLNWLDVEVSPRYISTSTKTYCNIYAYDVAYCLGTYIPRVWWSRQAIDRIVNDEEVETVYGETVFEQNCNALYHWFEEFGQLFSWLRIEKISEFQSLVDNKGTLGIIVAQRTDPSLPGHITVVIPNKSQPNSANSTTLVLQSQAGEENRKLFHQDWWSDTTKFKNLGFWILDI